MVNDGYFWKTGCHLKVGGGSWVLASGKAVDSGGKVHVAHHEAEPTTAARRGPFSTLSLNVFFL